MKKFASTVIFATLISTQINAACSEVLTGSMSAYDGDTITINEVKLRLSGIDAPEIDQEYGLTALEALLEFADGKEVSCNIVDLDVYNRPLAFCYPQTPGGAWSTVSLNRRMVQQGHAAAFLRYDSQFAIYMQTAMKECRGMWATAGLPWCWRRK